MSESVKRVIAMALITLVILMIGGGGQYQWAQLIQAYHFKVLTSTGPKTCTAVSSSVLDNIYPYPAFTRTVTDDSTNDSPGLGMVPQLGELAGSFSASLYLMWVPPVLNGCPTTKNACTIPVPEGAFQWGWWGDAINTSELVILTVPVVPQWVLNDASGSNNNGGFVGGGSLPRWSATWINNQFTCN